MLRPGRLTPAVAALLAASGAAAPAAAQAVARRDSTALPEVSVTATRLALPRAEVPASQTVITGEELRARGVVQLLDVLRDVPGAAVVSTGGGYGALTSLFLRGGQSNYTKVLIDGVPVNEPGGSFDFGNLTADNVDRIEIVRGPVSVLYGADAVAGVIQIFTRRGSGRVTGSAGGVGGSYGSYQGEAALRGGSGGTSYSAQLSRFGSDGVLPFNNGYRNTVGSALVRIEPDARTDLQLSARFGDNLFRFPTNSAGVAVDSNQFNTERTLALGLDAGRRLGRRVEARLLVANYTREAGFENAPDFPGDTTRFAFESQRLASQARRSVDGRVNVTLGARATLTAGAVAEFESIRQFNRSLNGSTRGSPTLSATAFDADRRTLSGYVQAVTRPVQGLAATASARVDDNSAFGTFLTWRAGAVYTLARTGTRLRASAGRAFKAPTFLEQFDQSPFSVGNPGLVPERATSWEAGVEQGLLGERLVLSATYFDQRFRDLVQYGTRPGAAFTYYNVAAAFARGVETAIEYRAPFGLVVAAQYTWLDTEVTNSGFSTAPGAAFVNGAALIRRPPRSGRLGVRYRLRDLATLGANLNFVGGRDDVDFNRFPSARVTLPSYTLLEASALVDVLRPALGRPGMQATLRVENLLDARYTAIVGFPGRGRTVLAGARVAF